MRRFATLEASCRIPKSTAVEPGFRSISRREVDMRIQHLTASTFLVLAASALAASAQPAAPNLSGNYRCEPHPAACRNGSTISITQNGTKLEMKNEKGEQANGEVTSNISLSVGGPWSMMGVIHDGAIEWSNGTKWRKL
jgi:hypothetical protein